MTPARTDRARRRRCPVPLAAVLWSVGIAGLPGCAAHRGPPSPPPTLPPRPAPGYDAMRDTLDALDAGAVTGRRIVLDPGHGGVFRGALGVNGLTEAEVNLGVALRLRDLLAARGARVLLTRESDRDFLVPADSTLRADLAERVRVANAFDPDLFVSIHHNADPAGAHDVNATATYYKLGDEGPSLDVAQDVHRALVHNVGIVANKVAPGNYFVLRGSTAPAILTETSYITDPDVEARLRLPAGQELEAEALAVGVVRYFARPAPVIASFVAFDDARGVADTLFQDGPGPTLRARIAGTFDRAELRVDGAPVRTTRWSEWIEWTPDSALAPGDHAARLAVRLGGVGAARERECAFTVRRPARRLVVRTLPRLAPRAGGLVGVRVDAVDAYGFVVGDTLSVRLRTHCACDVPRVTALSLRAGSGWAYVNTTSAARRPKGATGALALTVEAVPRAGAAPLAVATFAPAFAPAGAAGWRTAFLRRMPGDSALVDTSGALGFETRTDWLDRDGFAVFLRDSAGNVVTPRLPGFRPWAADSLPFGIPTRWVAIAGGALHGRRITLDPEGGGDDAAGQGPQGTRASMLNLETARILAGFLEAAGAEVRLTRTGDAAMSDVERVQASEAFRADRFLRIGHRAARARTGYYFSSAGGRRWAGRTSATLASLGLDSLPAQEDAQYTVQQTSCPSLFVSPARIDDAASEQRLLGPGTLRLEAYALFLALAGEWAGEAAWPVDSLEVRSAGGAPVPGAAVTLAGTLVLETDALGRARFARTETGPMTVDIADPRAIAHAVLLDSSRGVTLTGSRGR